MKWVTETEARLKVDGLSLDMLRYLAKQGSGLPQSRNVEATLGKVTTMLDRALDWEQKVKTALRQK